MLACLGLVGVLGAGTEAAAQGKPATVARPPAPAPVKPQASASPAPIQPTEGAPDRKEASALGLLPMGSGADPRVQAIFDQAVQTFDAGKVEDAWKLLNQAWTLNRGESYDIAGNLGIVALKLGRNVEAAHFLTIALKKFPVTGEAAARKGLSDKLGQARAQVGVVIVRVQPDDAAVTVNGRPEPRERLEAGEVFVMPGEVAFEAKAPGYLPEFSTRTVAPGKRAEVALTLRREPPLWPALVAGGVGLAGAATGAALMLAGASEGAEAESLYNAILADPGSSTCADGAANIRCPELQETAQRADTLHNVGVGFLIGGGAVLAGAGGYLLWREAKRREGPPTPSVVVTPVVGSGGAAISVSGAF